MTVEQTHNPYVQGDGKIVRHGVCLTEAEKNAIPLPITAGSTIYVIQTDKDYIHTGTVWRDKAPAGGQHDHDSDYGPLIHDHNAEYSLIDHGHGPVGGEAFPVGSVFISVVATNPATLLGYGTWQAFGAGRFIVGLDAADPDFDTLEETGGAKTVTLTTAQMPAHTHPVTSQTSASGAATSYEHGTLDTSSTDAEATEVTGSTGSGAAHPNVPPYIVCRMWKRVS